MKKLLFFVPALIFSVFYGLLAIDNWHSVSPVAFAWVAAFVISGALLAKGVLWGGLVGMLPGVHFMYMSTVDTGQALPLELPLGVIVVAFYAGCCVAIWRRKRKAGE